jgi:soluble lytic murein transglycosylase-like protein
MYRYRDENGQLRLTNVSPSAAGRLTVAKLSQLADDSKTQSFDIYILQAADLFDVPFPLIKAMIRVESNFDPEALSHAGAKGLMQLMPNIQKHYGIYRPYDPEANIMAGTRYFKTMLEAFGGDLELALAAYNAGPYAVKKHQGVPPYRETQGYVVRVLDFYHEYAAAQRSHKTLSVACESF